jgi:hypothetical protein
MRKGTDDSMDQMGRCCPFRGTPTLFDWRAESQRLVRRALGVSSLSCLYLSVSEVVVTLYRRIERSHSHTGYICPSFFVVPMSMCPVQYTHALTLTVNRAQGNADAHRHQPIITS